MKVIPAIDIRNGRCIRLVEGDYDREVVFDDQPVSAALRWRDMGAEMIHIVDLDGAKDGIRPNDSIVKSVISSVDIPVQVGGGIRTLSDASALLEIGAERVVFGTALVEDPETVADAVTQLGHGHVAVSIDAKNGEVRTHGWRSGSGLDAIELAMSAVQDIAAKTVIYTDTSRDGTLSGPNLDSVRELVRALPIESEVISAGGISGIQDLLDLSDIGVTGAITGMAIYTGQITLAEAIRAVASHECSRNA